MRLLVCVFCAVFAVACVDRSGCLTGYACVHRFCVLQGDTIGVIKEPDSTHHVTRCVWLLSDKTVCDSIGHPSPAHPTCRVGESL